MKFRELINRNNFLKNKFKNLEDHFKDVDIDGISNNSKNIKKNFIFFAFDGNKTDGNLYIEEAKKNGSPVPITEIIDGYYAEVQEMGGNRWDSSGLIARLKKKK